LKQSSYTGQNWSRSQSTLSTGTLPMRKYRRGSWYEAQGLYAQGSERIPPMAWVFAVVFISIAVAAIFVGSGAGL